MVIMICENLHGIVQHRLWQLLVVNQAVDEWVASEDGQFAVDVQKESEAALAHLRFQITAFKVQKLSIIAS